MARLTFRKHEHLCGALRIREVATTGAAVNMAPFRLVGKVMELPTIAPAQVAFAVPKRGTRLAVDRNRVKRLMREAYRLEKPALIERLKGRKGQVAWLFIFQGRDTPTLAEARVKISRALHRWLDEHE